MHILIYDLAAISKLSIYQLRIVALRKRLCANDLLEAISKHTQRCDVYAGFQVRQFLAQERNVSLNGILGRLAIDAPDARKQILL